MFVRKQTTIDVERSYRYDQKWTTIAKTEKQAMDELLEVLERSSTGKKVVEKSRKKAETYGKTLEELLLPGEGSLTDTTLVRKFAPANPNEVVYESRSKVYINRNLSVKNALLDLAHELTHFALREPFNPYQAPFGLKDFITSTVEGRGGEVEAYLVECQVLFEIFKERNQDSNCHRVVDPSSGRVNKGRGIHEFYQLGRFYKTFHNSLRRHDMSPTDFEATSQAGAHFISSAYGLPYPLAAVHEYEAIMERVCQNDGRRLAIMRDNISRQPASQELATYRSLASVHEKRCARF
ncbi:MAG: hypothetical protein K9K67_08615 [Bacteriovoracaceae bacterium]|nr:hypothetical protein [Bacteriovoracaceae bacterium]